MRRTQEVSYLKRKNATFKITFKYTTVALQLETVNKVVAFLI